MKVKIQKRDTDKTLIIEADRIAVKTPESQEYLIEAEVDEGDSPIRILMSSGQSLPVKRLALGRKGTYQVKAFRSKGTGPYEVPAHQRALPTRLKSYQKRVLSEATKKKISETQKRRFANPELRAHMSRAMKESIKRRKEKSSNQ